MLDKDVAPADGFPERETEIKTPWETIEPDGQKNPAPPQRAKPLKKSRRGKKAALAVDANLSTPSVFAATTTQTDAGGSFANGADDPDEALAIKAFLPDEFATPLEDAETTTDLEGPSRESNEDDGDESLVEIFLDRSAADVAVNADSDTRLTAAAGLVDASHGATEKFEDDLVERAFFSDGDVLPGDAHDAISTQDNQAAHAPGVHVGSALADALDPPTEDRVRQGGPYEMPPSELFQSTNAAVPTIDEPLVELFVDQSAADSTAEAESEIETAVQTPSIDASVPSFVEDAVALADTITEQQIEPAVLDAAPTTTQPAPDSISFFEPAINVPAAGTITSARPSATDPWSVPQHVFVSEVVESAQSAPEPAIVAGVNSIQPVAENVRSVPRDFFHEEIVAEAESANVGVANSDAGSEVLRRAGSIAEESGSSEYVRTGVDGERAGLESASIPANRADDQVAEPASQSIEPVVAPSVTIAFTESTEPTVVVGDEVQPEVVPAAPIRYLRPIAGSLVRRPKPVLAVEPQVETELDPAGAGRLRRHHRRGMDDPAHVHGNLFDRLLPDHSAVRSQPPTLLRTASMQADLNSIQKQVSVNDEFLKEVIDNPTLAERLASRQMKTIRKGQKVLAVRQVSDDGDMSPFALVAVPRPAATEPYRPVIGTIANLCNNSRSRTYLLGASMAMVAMGLVLGFSPKKAVEV